MPPVNFSLPSSPVLGILLTLAWLAYICIYWRAMVLILGASKLDAQEKILWFLVITLAPLIGLVTFHVMCPPPMRNTPPRP